MKKRCKVMLDTNIFYLSVTKFEKLYPPDKQGTDVAKEYYADELAVHRIIESAKSKQIDLYIYQSKHPAKGSRGLIEELVQQDYLNDKKEQLIQTWEGCRFKNMEFGYTGEAIVVPELGIESISKKFSKILGPKIDDDRHAIYATTYKVDYFITRDKGPINKANNEWAKLKLKTKFISPSEFVKLLEA